VGEGDCEIIVTVYTEQDRINFPMSSIDGFPIRVQVGSISIEDPKATVPEENATAPTPPPPTTPPEREEEEQPPAPAPPSTDGDNGGGGGNSTAADGD
jgi:hypothetical protein